MPWPKEEPTGQNPPDGAIINYYLKAAATGPVTLEILQSDGRLLRRYSSTDPVPQIPDPPSAPWPVYWYRPAATLATTAGMHRFLWDVHLQPLGAGAAAGGGLGAVPTQLPIQAIPYNSPNAATTPWAAPGTYTVKLTVDGKSYSQPIVVKQDPRVRTPALEMQRVYTLDQRALFRRGGCAGGGDRAGRVARAGRRSWRRRQVRRRRRWRSSTGRRRRSRGRVRQQVADAAAGRARRPRCSPVDQPAAGAPGRGAPPAAAGGRGAAAACRSTDTLWSTTAALSGVMNALQAADVSPTTNTLNALTAAQANAAAVMARWRALKTIDLPALNLKLKAAGAQPLVTK